MLEGIGGGQPVMTNRLTRQIAWKWSRMAEGNLAAASQMAWQSSDEVSEQRSLFEKVSGRSINEATWRNMVTWSSAVLLALSIEQSLKTLAIQTSTDSACLKGHDLHLLWRDIPKIAARTSDRSLVLFGREWRTPVSSTRRCLTLTRRFLSTGTRLRNLATTMKLEGCIRGTLTTI